MTVPGNIDALLLGGQRGYQIERSLRFNSPDSAYLNRTYSGACLDAKLMTISVWVKRGKLTTSGHQPIFSSYSAVRFGGDLTWTPADKIQFRPGGNGDGASNQYSISTDAVFRDPSAWYHIVIQYDSTQATSTNRQKIYVNGVQQTVTGNYPTQNYLHTYAFNNANNQIGAYTSYGTDYLDSYLTEFHFIDGQALTPSSFGETDTITGVWKPKRYAGTYGTNGFYLKFADNSGTTSTTLGKDSSGNGNNWTPNNFSVTAGAGNDSMIDTPTPYADGGNGRGNYATLNPLAGNTICVLSNGNLNLAATTSDWCRKISTIGVSSGKWYAEFTFTTAGTNTNQVGVVSFVPPVNGSNQNGEETGQSMYNGNNNASLGTIFNDGTRVSTGNTTASSGDVIGVALDASANNVKYYRNGTIVGSSSGYTPTNVSGIWYFVAQCLSSGVIDCNFGQRAFAYTPPSGFLALNTQNLPEPSIKKPSSYMDVKLYTGNGSTQTISGLGFSPDLVWIKSRSSGSSSHFWYDTVRGINKRLYSDGTGAETNQSPYGLTAFNSDGFSLNDNTTGDYGVNGSTTYGPSYVAWCWDESATPGFDIVTYTGNGGTAQTIGHSLGVVPNFIVIKNRDSADGWAIYHSSIGATGYLDFTTGSTTTSASTWNNTSPTSSVFTVNTNTRVNGSSTKHVAYLWSEVAGFSKFGSYTGNGSADGPFVFCGFRPRWIMFKNSTTGGNSWHLYDTLRSGSGGNNTLDYLLMPNNSNAEEQNLGSTPYVDALSNGFKIRRTGSGANTNGDTYIFAAFAESPQKYSLAR